MALSHADRSATDIAAAAAGSPCLLGYNKMDDLSACRWDADGDMSGGSDITAAGYPVTRAYDDQLDTYTKPNAAAANQYFMVDFGATGISFDAIVLVYSVLSAAPGMAPSGGAGGILIYCDDAAAFPSPHALAVAWYDNWSGTFAREGDRICRLSLTTGTAQAFSGVRYVRVHFQGDATLIPAIHEFWIGTQYQLPRRPVYPFQAENYKRIASSYESDSGKRSTYKKESGLWLYDGEIQLTSTTEKSNVSSWRVSNDFGCKPAWIVGDPTDTYNVGNPNDYLASCRARLCAVESDVLEVQRQQYGEWKLRLQASEHGGRSLFDEEGTIS